MLTLVSYHAEDWRQITLYFFSVISQQDGSSLKS